MGIRSYNFPKKHLAEIGPPSVFSRIYILASNHDRSRISSISRIYTMSGHLKCNYQIKGLGHAFIEAL